MHYSIEIFIIIEFIIFLFRKKRINIFLYICLAIYLGMRDLSIGTDTIEYSRQYLGGTGGYFSEKIFVELGRILYKLKLSIHQYFVFVSVMNMLLYYCGIKKIVKNKYKFANIFYIFVFNVSFLYGSINILRQSLATGLFILSIAFLNENKKVKSFIVLLISTGFHISTIFMFPVLFFRKIYSKLNFYYQILGLILVFIIGNFSLPIILKIHKFHKYYYMDLNNQNFYIKYIILLGIYFIFIFYNREYNLNLSAYILFYGIIFMLFFIRIPAFTSRMIYYFSVFATILLYDIFENRKNIFLFFCVIYHIFVLFYPSTQIMFSF